MASGHLLRRRIALSLSVACATALTCAACFGAVIYWETHVNVDIGEVTGWSNFQLWMAASRFEDWAKEHDGSFPQGETAQALLVPSPSYELDPWDRPFRFEVLSPNGTEARVFSLGRDNQPGGEGLDADIVWWIGPKGVSHASDSRVRPSSWYQRDKAESR